MICLKTQHFNVHRILLLTVGLWPYERSKLVQLQLIVLFSILSSSVVFQVCLAVLCLRDISGSSPSLSRFLHLTVRNLTFVASNTSDLYL